MGILAQRYLAVFQHRALRALLCLEDRASARLRRIAILVGILVDWCVGSQTGWHMKTIVLASRKGGAGKTTLTCHLAVEAERAGYGPVAIIDTDEMAGLSKWWDRRKADTPVLARPEPTLAAALDVMRSAGARLVFVDTPPAATSGIAAALAAADMVLVPVQATPDDIDAIPTTIAMVERAGKPMAFAINRVKPRVKLTSDAAITLSQWGTVAPREAWIWDRTDYAGAKLLGLTAPEMEADGRAAAEVAALWNYLVTRMGVARAQARSAVA
jgi:chromosome partitioning protein